MNESHAGQTKSCCSVSAIGSRRPVVITLVLQLLYLIHEAQMAFDRAPAGPYASEREKQQKKQRSGNSSTTGGRGNKSNEAGNPGDSCFATAKRVLCHAQQHKLLLV